MLRSIPLHGRTDLYVLTEDEGDFALLSGKDVRALNAQQISESHPRYDEFFAKGFIRTPQYRGLRRLEAAVSRTRKSFLLNGPSLHIFVVTLRCDHSCQYCQVSRAAIDASGFDMDLRDALAGVERVFESSSRDITIEFQGGEPALRFDIVRFIVERAEALNFKARKRLRFTMATTLHHLGDHELNFCRDHEIHLSTSIDGPTHNRHRPIPTKDSLARTLAALEHARAIVGAEMVTALPTLTRSNLSSPVELIEYYRDLGFASIFLRSLSPYGFARKSRLALGYSVAEFLTFYEIALGHILELNRTGQAFEETTASILLRHMLTPFHSGYMDLRSPSSAGIGVLVYNYDGRVYPSDEARMAAEAGEKRLGLGSVHDSLDALLSSPAMRWLSQGAVADRLPGCAECAFVPYCGADPVHHVMTQGDPIGDRATSAHCEKYKGLFHILFDHIANADPDTLRTFTAWALQKDRRDILPEGWIS